MAMAHRLCCYIAPTTAGLAHRFSVCDGVDKNISILPEVQGMAATDNHNEKNISVVENNKAVQSKLEIDELMKQLVLKQVLFETRRWLSTTG
jgi:hypothetical protein